MKVYPEVNAVVAKVRRAPKNKDETPSERLDRIVKQVMARQQRAKERKAKEAAGQAASSVS